MQKVIAQENTVNKQCTSTSKASCPCRIRPSCQSLWSVSSSQVIVLTRSVSVHCSCARLFCKAIYGVDMLKTKKAYCVYSTSQVGVDCPRENSLPVGHMNAVWLLAACGAFVFYCWLTHPQALKHSISVAGSM